MCVKVCDKGSMAYSKDFRERAIAYKDEGHTYEELYEAFKYDQQHY